MPAARPLAAVLMTASAFALAVAFQGPPEVAPAPHPLPDPLPGVAGPVKYWKGNVHTHTLWSDGDDFPEMVVDWYKQHGYQFLALTDHNIIADGEKWIDAESTATRQRAVRKYAARFGERWPEYRTVKDKKQVRLKPLAEFRSLFEEPSKFLLVPAEEITHSYAKRPIHMNGINLRDTVKPLDGKDAIETITVNLRQVADQRKKTGRAMIAFLNHPNWLASREEMLSAPELRYLRC